MHAVFTTALLMTAMAAGPDAGFPEGFDQYGGWKAVRFEPSPFFRTHHDGERWWLVTPEGHAFLSIGACVVGPRGSFIRGTRKFPYHEAVLAKHGDEKAWAKVTRRRLIRWGFNTKGGWSGGEVRNLPHTEILNCARASGGNWLTGGMPDFFDPGFVDGVERATKRCAQMRDDPWLVGYFLDNELAWDRDWRLAPNLFIRYGRLPADAPGKQAWCKLLRDRYKTVEAFNETYWPTIASWDELPAIPQLHARRGKQQAANADRDAFVYLAARKYFKTCAEAIRAKDPHHLIMGCRLVSWVAPTQVIKACGEFCDVVSINHYELGPFGLWAYNRWKGEHDYIADMPDLTEFHTLTNKPLMITEFGFRSMDSGLPNTYPPPIMVQPTVKTQAERAARYAKYVKQWMSKPFFVGYHWFRYMDEPKEGRFDGEDGNYGLVDIKDEPYAPFVKAVTQVNQSVWTLHRGAN